MKLIKWVFILSLGMVGAARADDIVACPPPAGVTNVPFDQVPAAIRKALHDRVGDMALPGQPFETSDVVSKPLPRSRGIFAWNRGTRWVVAIEHGGRAYNDPVYSFGTGVDGKGIRLAATHTAVAKTVCAIATAAVDAP